MSLLQNEQEPVLYPWYHGYSPFLLGARPIQAGAPPTKSYTPLAESNPLSSSSPLRWIAAGAFVLMVVVLLLAVV